MDTSPVVLPEVQDLILQRDGDTLTIWFNRPETRNALSARMAAELAQVLELLPRARDLRFVLLRGKGGSFCSGGDLSMFRTVFQDGASREDIVESNAGFGRLLRSVRALPQLFVVAIEGAAMAGGLGLSCIADVVITTANARRGAPAAIALTKEIIAAFAAKRPPHWAQARSRSDAGE